MAVFGKDWTLARQGWLYPTEKLQGFWRAVGITAVLLAFNAAVQLLLAWFLVTYVFQGSFDGAKASQGADYAKVLQSGILAIFPAGLMTMFLALWLGKFGLPEHQGKLLLRWPRLGWLGWVVTVIGFMVLMFIILNLIFWATGINPETYSTSSAGLSDSKSSAGLVEKTISGLAANQPWLFALAIPALIFGAPLAEEVTFRGPLFSALVKSPVGKIGAVVITAALWAVAHGATAPLLIIGLLFLMGVALGVLLLRVGSLWVTIACHSAWNLIQALGLLAAAMAR